MLDRARADREKLTLARVDLIKRYMAITEVEGKQFWPIQKRCERELYEAGDVALRTLAETLAAHPDGRLDDAEARSLLEAYFTYQERRVEILRKHCDEIAQALSPLRAAQYAQIEHRVQVGTDTYLAAAMPLISGKAGDP